MEISLIFNKLKPISVCVGRFSFAIENGELQHNEDSRAGCDYYGELKNYEEAYELALWGWENQMFDEILHQ